MPITQEITALSNVPSLASLDTFESDMDYTLNTGLELRRTEMNTFATQANALAVAMNLNATTDTSTSSVAIGTGAKSFTVSLDKSFQPGMWLVIADTAAPSTNQMYGTVTSYDVATGALVMSIVSVRGSGTKTAWVISQSAPGGAAIGPNGDITSLTGLTSPITGVGDNSKIQPITAVPGSSAMTVTLNPTSLDFRSATITSGAVNTRTVPASISCVVPSGATLGTSSTYASRIAVLAIDNAGTVELAVVNAAGGLRLDGTNLISTTALSAGSDSDNVIYSTTARSNVPFRVAGYIESTQATAGTWATAPSKIQGAGAELASVSVRRWRNLIASRTNGVIYSVGWDEPERDVAVSIYSTANSTFSLYVYPAGEIAAGFEVVTSQGAATVSCALYATVSPGDSYQVVNSAGTTTVYRWAERY